MLVVLASLIENIAVMAENSVVKITPVIVCDSVETVVIVPSRIVMITFLGGGGSVIDRKVACGAGICIFV